MIAISQALFLAGLAGVLVALAAFAGWLWIWARYNGPVVEAMIAQRIHQMHHPAVAPAVAEPPSMTAVAQWLRVRAVIARERGEREAARELEETANLLEPNGVSHGVL